MLAMEDTVQSKLSAVLLLIGPQIDAILDDLVTSLEEVVSQESGRVVVWIESDELNSPKYQEWKEIHRLLTTIYIRATEVTHRLDKVLFQVDVVLRRPGHLSWTDKAQALGFEPTKVYLKHAGESVQECDRDSSMLIMDRDPQTVSSDIPVFGSTNESYQFPVVAMGGTFDHLHAGHKILLSCAAFLATSKLIVGMTSDSLLTKKRHVEILEHLDERTKKTREFLQLVKPGLELDLPPLTDIYGPTGWDPNVQALVVSKETLSGANAIATHRREKDLPPLKDFVIDVIAPDGSNITSEDGSKLKDLKISSTAIREYIVATPSRTAEQSKYTPRGPRQPNVSQSGSHGGGGTKK